MSDVRIARAFPDLPENQALVALLGETLGLARGMKLSRQGIDAAGADAEQVKELLSQTGLMDEIDDAEKATTATVVELLAKVSEQDLEQGLNQGLLSSEDCREAFTAKRTMSLQRGRTSERDHDLER